MAIKLHIIHTQHDVCAVCIIYSEYFAAFIN